MVAEAKNITLPEELACRKKESNPATNETVSHIATEMAEFRSPASPSDQDAASPEDMLASLDKKTIAPSVPTCPLENSPRSGLGCEHRPKDQSRLASCSCHSVSSCKTPVDYSQEPKKPLTPNEFAKRHRIGHDKVMKWIRAGRIGAINVASDESTLPRYLITVEAQEKFLKDFAVVPTEPPPAKLPAVTRRQRRRDRYVRNPR